MKSGIATPPTYLALITQNYLAILGLSWFHVNFRNFSSRSATYTVSILIGTALNMNNGFESVASLTILVLPVQDQWTFYIF